MKRYANFQAVQILHLGSGYGFFLPLIVMHRCDSLGYVSQGLEIFTKGTIGPDITSSKVAAYLARKGESRLHRLLTMAHVDWDKISRNLIQPHGLSAHIYG